MILAISSFSESVLLSFDFCVETDGSAEFEVVFGVDGIQMGADVESMFFAVVGVRVLFWGWVLVDRS